jgi:hypothetical protein
MSGARWQDKFLHGIFGGKEMTLFHLKRLDSSDGSETLEDVKHGRLTSAQQGYSMSTYMNTAGSTFTSGAMCTTSLFSLFEGAGQASLRHPGTLFQVLEK